MLGSIRKFSSSIFAKIFLFIVAIPFVFWGMGDVFRGGNQNTIVKIDKEKISVEEFINHLNNNILPEEKINEIYIDKMLSSFIGEKLIEREIENLNIKLSDKSLSRLIRNEKLFQKKNQFSRIEYEKFLVSKSISAVSFEENISKQFKKRQLLDFVSKGVVPTNFLVNINFNEANQERNVQIININNILKKKTNISNSQIQEFFNKNKKKYISKFKTINFLEVNPKNLTGTNEYGDLFFEKIDKIDDLIVEGKNLNFILKEFNLKLNDELTFDEFGNDKNGELIKNFPIELVKNIFATNQSDSTVLIAHQNKYIIIEITKVEEIQKEITDKNVKKDVLNNLLINSKRKFISKIINEINTNSFSKAKFENLSKKENVKIQNIIIKNKNDDETLSKNLIEQIYRYPEKKVIIIADIGLSESYLVYIDKIKTVTVKKDAADYETFFNLSKFKMISGLYNTYDAYLKSKYEIEINRKALQAVKNNIK
tara:strand:+ start:5971 stop:7419 length:1449 start_codon:yes stop_codon:yes gene_type:complete